MVSDKDSTKPISMSQYDGIYAANAHTPGANPINLQMTSNISKPTNNTTNPTPGEDKTMTTPNGIISMPKHVGEMSTEDMYINNTDNNYETRGNTIQ